MAARMYYEDGLSQSEVAAKIGVSRPTVSRLLSYARQSGIVQIVLTKPDGGDSLTNELQLALGLSRAIVVDVTRNRAPEEAIALAARAEVAGLLLGPGDTLGLSWGGAMLRLAHAASGLGLEGVKVVPIVGGMDEIDQRFQSNEIAREFAVRSGGQVVFIMAPVTPAGDLARRLRDDPDYGQRLALWDNLTAAVVGMGMRPEAASYLPAHLQWARQLTGAAGDVAGCYFTIEGEDLRPPGDAGMLAITHHQLRNTPYVLGVASDPGKAESIIGASRGHLVTALVTDTVTARKVLDRLT
ncbi:MAG: sugar-binding domain-containing protein [Propionicimonas sp.]